MSDYLTDALVEQAALADLNHWRGERNALAPLTGLDDVPDADEWRGGARAALEAVLPDLIRDAKDEALREMSERHNHMTRDIKDRDICPACDAARDRVSADQRSKEKTMIDPRHTCTLCDGEGWTDDNLVVYERVPWSMWENLPPAATLGALLLLIKKVPCIRCGESDD